MDIVSGETSFSSKYLQEVQEIAERIDPISTEKIISGLAGIREREGRLFILGVGGGAANASHAVNDFRKICGIESYAPTDNVSELTARTNDDGWDSSFIEWLKTSKLNGKDGILVFSVGGGSREYGLSINLVRAIEYAKEVGASVYGIVGKSEGTTAALADECIVIDAPPERITPHVEGFQAVILHLLVSHPALARTHGTWETVSGAEGK